MADDATAALIQDLQWQIDQMRPRGIGAEASTSPRTTNAGWRTRFSGAALPLWSMYGAFSTSLRVTAIGSSRMLTRWTWPARPWCKMGRSLIRICSPPRTGPPPRIGWLRIWMRSRSATQRVALALTRPRTSCGLRACLRDPSSTLRCVPGGMGRCPSPASSVERRASSARRVEGATLFGAGIRPASYCLIPAGRSPSKC